ncbi:MAG: tail fiber domain-containing protein [Prevotellaceae bacterium]|jgi:hypothetical protein|nr:tail fiber domain-containing protein [Prevotellaceae bacterium]
MKKVFIFSVLFAVVANLSAQLKVANDGKISIGTPHSLDNGILKIGKDGMNQGLSFYDAQTGGTDLKIFRSGNVAYFLRGTNPISGMRMDLNGNILMGKTTIAPPTTGGSLRVYGEGVTAILACERHPFDYGTTVVSVGNRNLSCAFTVVNQVNGWDVTAQVLTNGEMTATTYYTTSDSIYKKNIKTIQSPLEKILKLRGVTYNSKLIDENAKIVVPQEKKENDKFSVIPSNETVKQIEGEMKRQRIGLIAQEVEEVVPEVVRTTPKGSKTIAYSELVGLLIEAMKEQQVQIEKQQEQIKQLAKLSGLKTIDETVFTKNNITDLPFLLQNTPNPFNQSTEIGYYIPETVKAANLYIYDINGGQQKQITITERGKGASTIQAAMLPAGIYFYTLICDGSPVDSKQMILTK